MPAFLSLNYGNQGVSADPDITPSRNSICGRGEHAHRWPLELLLERGYAVASFHGGDIELDRHGSGCRFTLEGWQTGIRHYVMQQAGHTELASDQWGSIAAWAWGLSRALDYLQTDPLIDGHRVAVIGHSRTGKAALWAGAQDQRFSLVISNNSGQGGAALARRRYGESVAASYALSGIWYCRNYEKYGNNEGELPVDAHLLIAAMAPRPVYVASAELDRWADPRGEFLAVLHAEPVYRLFGLTGVGVEEMPEVDQPVGRTAGYHIAPVITKLQTGILNAISILPIGTFAQGDRSRRPHIRNRMAQRTRNGFTRRAHRSGLALRLSPHHAGDRSMGCNGAAVVCLSVRSLLTTAAC